MIVTPSQTIGPYFRIAIIRDDAKPALLEGEGSRIAITGVMVDGEGQPVIDGLLEIWDATRRAFGRFPTDVTGAFRIETLQPRAVVQPDGSTQAAHLAVGVFARGLLKRLYTRMYFADNPANAVDPILALVAADRRSTLVATPTDEARRNFTFDIRLSGAHETVFFEC